MPMNAKDIVFQPVPPPPPPLDVAGHISKIDELLSRPWEPWELTPGPGNDSFAGRVYPARGLKLSDADAQEITCIYRAADWDVYLYERGRLCFVPKRRPS